MDLGQRLSKLPRVPGGLVYECVQTRQGVSGEIVGSTLELSRGAGHAIERVMDPGSYGIPLHISPAVEASPLITPMIAMPWAAVRPSGANYFSRASPRV